MYYVMTSCMCVYRVRAYVCVTSDPWKLSADSLDRSKLYYILYHIPATYHKFVRFYEY